MSETTNLRLPYIEASQAQKHVTHNEALLVLDALIQTGVLDKTLSTPPASPEEGDCYIPVSGSSGEWSNQGLSVAIWQDGTWKFHTPKKGWIVYLAGENKFAFWNGSLWGNLGSAMGPLQNLTQLGVNTTADNTNKLAVSSNAMLFTHAGKGVQHKLNKSTAVDTASVLFQTNWSGRAEVGTTGDDDFHFKVSPNGANWFEAIRTDRKTGSVTFPNGALVERHIPVSIDGGGGADWWGPADHLTISYNSGTALALTTNRLYFAAFYLPRPLELIGCFVSQSVASTTTGAVLRAGIYQLGAPNANSWDIGNLVVDFGTQAGDVAGNKVFDLASPLTLDPGWYVTGFGLSGANGKAIYSRWFSPGLARFLPHGSGESCRPRVAGPSVFLYDDGCNAEITGGLPPQWTKNPVNDVSSTNNWVYQCVMPKWRQL